MIKSFEPVYKEIEKLIIEKLPDYIQKINMKYNDGVILKPFENKDLEENCLTQPCFIFTSERAAFSEKDRIIGFAQFYTYFEIKTGVNEKNKVCRFWRYIEAIDLMLSEEETQFDYETDEAGKNMVQIMVTVEF